MDLFCTYVLISNTTNNKTTYVRSDRQPENSHEMASFEYFWLILLKELMNEEIDWGTNKACQVEVLLTNQQLNKAIESIEQKISEGGLEPTMMNEWNKILRVLRKIQ